MFYANHHSDNFTIIDCRLPDLRKSLTVIGSSMNMTISSSALLDGMPHI